MKKSIIILLCIAGFHISCLAQNNMNKDERSIGQFNAIKTCCGVDVYITEGTSSILTVESNYADVLDKIKTEISGNELKISVRENNISKGRRNLQMKVYVTANNLKSIITGSGADVFSTNQLQADDIELHASSGGDIEIDLKANNIKVSAGSGGDVTLKGSASSAKVNASSGGDIEMKQMTVNNAVAKASSGGDITIHVTGELEAHASSSGDITYYGNPKTVNKKASSGGDITGK